MRKLTLEQRIARLEKLLVNEKKMSKTDLDKVANEVFNLIARHPDLQDYFDVSGRYTRGYSYPLRARTTKNPTGVIVVFSDKLGSYTGEDLDQNTLAKMYNILNRYINKRGFEDATITNPTGKVMITITTGNAAYDNSDDAMWEDPDFQDMRHSADAAQSQKEMNW